MKEKKNAIKQTIPKTNGHYHREMECVTAGQYLIPKRYRRQQVMVLGNQGREVLRRNERERSDRKLWRGWRGDVK